MKTITDDSYVLFKAAYFRRGDKSKMVTLREIPKSEILPVYEKVWRR